MGAVYCINLCCLIFGEQHICVKNLILGLTLVNTMQINIRPKYIWKTKHLKYNILSHDFKHKADYKICLMFGFPHDT